ncbi:hypothetical protein ACFOOM_03435 [Streptomyces echinoruber]|uniref:Uncharacterized protein n=1 Tax=Streptomyces echinoruber TaxID=68898 RepID=A0A918QRY9_9ACTN|nr:hypothetical protein [Streptomyces echinoruber]GGZ70294.1 hypothetical protein GCM10010389_04630 [Streptomyces echinoruber]
MGAIVLSAAVVLVLLGFGNHLWWLVAVALLFLYVRYGPGASAAPPPAGGAAPATYRDYRERRDRQARWERRYRRERPFEARRQEREKSR